MKQQLFSSPYPFCWRCVRQSASSIVLRRREGDLFSGSARADEAGTWGRSSVGSSGGGGGGGGGDSWGGPRRSDSDAGPPSGDRPRLKLAARTKPAPVIKVGTLYQL